MRNKFCPYCTKLTLTNLPIVANWDTQWVTSLIADNEIIICTGPGDGTFGIPINYCPICGKKLEVNENE